MMIYIFILVFFLMLIYIPYFRCAVFHPFSTLYYFILDLFRFIRFKRWRECTEYGKIICATALFGGGKTLTSTVYLRHLFKRYDGKIVFNKRTGSWVRQNVIIHSNVTFNDIPFILLESTQDIIDVQSNFSDDNFMDVHLFFIDEASTQLNSRSFKKNFENPDLLNTILTCRHVKIGIVLTAQRFLHMDALMRQVTATAKECSHFWRLYAIQYFDAWSIENVSDITKIKPLMTRTLFIKDKDYAAYDTFAIVGNLIKSQKDGDMETATEILTKRGYAPADDPRANYRRSVNKRINK